MPDHDDRSDEALVRLAREGDHGAIESLLARYSAKLLHRIRSRLSGGIGRKVAPSDVLQEAHVVAVERLSDFEDRGEGSFKRWLDRIVELKIREAVRRYAGTEKRGVRREVSGSRLPTLDPAAAGPSPSQVAIGEELKTAARAALAKLPPDQRRVLELLQDRQLTIEETAGRMGRSPGAVKKLYGRALARLEELLELGSEGGGARRRPTR